MKRPPISTEIDAIWNAPLDRDEFIRRVDAAIAELDGAEMENVGNLIRWFCRRYPTPAARLAYAQKKRGEEVRSTTILRAEADR